MHKTLWTRDWRGQFDGIHQLQFGPRKVTLGPLLPEIIGAFVRREKICFSIESSQEGGISAIEVMEWRSMLLSDRAWVLEFIFRYPNSEKPYYGQMTYDPYKKTGILKY